MMWRLIGNKWYDKWVKQFMIFSAELDSAACMTSPINSSERAEYGKIVKQLNDLNNQIADRLNKK